METGAEIRYRRAYRGERKCLIFRHLFSDKPSNTYYYGKKKLHRKIFVLYGENGNVKEKRHFFEYYELLP